MDITVQELKEKMERGESFVLIDVREPGEHQEFNIGGALIPLGMVSQAIPNLDEYMEEEIIIYCRSGRRSATAQYLMQQAGFANVRNLTGGVLAWMDAFGG
jgi:rhodanese-related sulfurtransferase